MLEEEICKLREKLNDSILNEPDYNVTYKLSVELDELIARYYSTQLTLASKTKKRKIKKNSKKELLANRWIWVNYINKKQLGSLIFLVAFLHDRLLLQNDDILLTISLQLTKMKKYMLSYNYFKKLAKYQKIRYNK